MSRRALAAALAAALALAGCAAPALRTAPPSPVTVPAGGAEARPAASPAPAPTALAAPDTVPSADALAVLAEIPEPLRAEEQVSAPAPHGGPVSPADAEGGRADVPVPARMPVLGERPLPDVAAPADSAPAAPAAPAPARPGTVAAAVPDTCWRVQFAAWSERAKSERYLAAARSQLGVPLAIEPEAGLFKVRTTGCLDGAAADALRRRAWGAGFAGAFRFRGGKP